MRHLLVAAALFFCICFPAQAADTDDFCRNGEFTDQSGFGIAEVSGQSRLYFLDDTDGCPQPEAHCRGRSYVVPGDRLLTARIKDRYICALYPNTGGGEAGWIEQSRIKPLPVENAPKLSGWDGRWVQGDNQIRLTARGNRLAIHGSAYWPSASPSRKQRPGGPNLGGIDAMAQPAGNQVVFADAPCRVTATLVGRFLIVDDNSQCGGLNVRFRGVYQPR
jgi:hypothetical protein